MPKKETTSSEKPAGNSRAALLSSRVEELERSQVAQNGAMAKMLERIRCLEDQGRLRQLAQRLAVPQDEGFAGKPAPGPKPARTIAPIPERVWAPESNELRREMCGEIRDFFLERWRDTIAVDDLAFVSSVWVEMLAVAIAATVNLKLEEFEQLDQRTKLVELAFDQLSRRTRDYVEQRKKHPITVQ